MKNSDVKKVPLKEPLSFLIIIPAHNEAETIAYCLDSLAAQTYPHFKVILVNDGSVDTTSEIVDHWLKKHQNEPRFLVVAKEKSAHAPGAKVVQAFNYGLQHQESEWDIICKFDADVLFPNDYLEKLALEYKADAELGMCAGQVFIPKSEFSGNRPYDFSNEEKQHWVFENISSKEHIRGPVKSYRWACFQEIGGLHPVLGWDNIDVALAQISGWKTKVIPDLWVKHVRPTGGKYKHQQAMKMGEYFYNLGLDWPLVILGAGKFALRKKSFRGLMSVLLGFSRQRGLRTLSAQQINAIRRHRYQSIVKKLKTKFG